MEKQRSALRYGMIYLFYYLAGSMFYSFFTLFLKTELNYTASQIGLIAAIGPIIGSLMIPVWGVFTDITRKPKLILSIAFAATALFLFAFSLSQITQYFGIVFVLAVVFNACFRPLTPLNDNFVTTSIKGTSINYNRVRAWGSLGFMFGGLIIGYIIDRTSINALFYVPILLFSITILIVATSPKITMEEGTDQVKQEKPKFKEIISELIKNKRYLVAVLIGTLAVASYGAIITFNSIIITELGGDIKLAGILAFASSALEVPVMVLVGQKLIEKKGSAFTLRIATGVLFVRCIIAYFINDPMLFVIVTATNGITVALQSPTTVLYIRSVVDSRMTASALTFYITLANIGMALGSLGLGYVMQFLPVKYVFFFAGVIALLAVLLTFKLQILDKKVVKEEVQTSEV